MDRSQLNIITVLRNHLPEADRDPIGVYKGPASRRLRSLELTTLENFAGHNLHLETERLRMRPFEDADFEAAAPFYADPEFEQAMEGGGTTRRTGYERLPS